ncbi:MAG: DUF2809 domain-containing protein [Myxococcota bacterium]
MNGRAAAVGALSLAAGIALFLWARGPVRGALGDVLVVVFLVASLAAVGVGSARSRLLGVGALAVGLESLQGLHLVGPDAPWIAHLVLGSTFDPLDLLAYLGGSIVAAGLERWWAISSPSGRASPPP